MSAEIGKLLVPVKERIYQLESAMAELSQLCKGELTGRESAQEVTLFKTVGTALADLVGAQLLHNQLQP